MLNCLCQHAGKNQIHSKSFSLYILAATLIKSTHLLKKNNMEVLNFGILLRTIKKMSYVFIYAVYTKFQP